jgi:hypothetical protein
VPLAERSEADGLDDDPLRTAVTTLLLQQRLLPDVMCTYSQHLQLAAMVEDVTVKMLTAAVAAAAAPEQHQPAQLSEGDLQRGMDTDSELKVLRRFLS